MPPKIAKVDPLEELLADHEQDAPGAPSAAASEPEAVGPVDHAGRVKLVVSALQEVDRLRLEFINQGGGMPSDRLLDRLADLLIAVAQCPSEPWPRSTWPFLGHISRVAHEISERGFDWRSPAWPWRSIIWEALREAADCSQDLLNPPPPPSPRVVPLETIEELVEQKVSPRQIAGIYSWFYENGEPDLERVKRAKAGEIKPPTEVVYPVEDNGPRRQPSLTLADQLAERFESERELERAEEPITRS